MRKAGIALSLLACLPVLARAGPPMITSDPGTPGDGRWENNFAVTLERRPSGRTWAAPDIDLNYGLGNSIVGVKWRFSDEEKHGISMSAKGEF